MKAPELATQRLVLDPAAAGDLRNRLRTDPQAEVRAARQFEGMLLHLMPKSMRDAMPTSGVLDSEQSRFFSAIGDQQLAQELLGSAGPARFRRLDREATGTATSGRCGARAGSVDLSVISTTAAAGKMFHCPSLGRYSRHRHVPTRRRRQSRLTVRSVRATLLTACGRTRLKPRQGLVCRRTS